MFFSRPRLGQIIIGSKKSSRCTKQIVPLTSDCNLRDYHDHFWQMGRKPTAPKAQITIGSESSPLGVKSLGHLVRLGSSGRLCASNFLPKFALLHKFFILLVFRSSLLCVARRLSILLSLRQRAITCHFRSLLENPARWVSLSSWAENTGSA